MRDQRIKFYSISDMSVGWAIREIENFLDVWEYDGQALSGNDVIELYNIKKFFDASLHLNYWDDKLVEKHQTRPKEIAVAIGKFCSALCDSNLLQEYESIDCEYKDDFWEMISKFKVYKRISATTLSTIFDWESRAIWYVLHHKDIVMLFDQVITNHLIHCKGTAKWLISHHLVRNDDKQERLYFPKTFSHDLQKQVLLEYLECETPDPNYLQLLSNAQSSEEFPLDDRLRLKARKKLDEVYKKLFANRSGKPYIVEVSFKSIPDGSIESFISSDHIKVAYSREWIEENRDYPTLLNNFIHQFEYVDRCARSTFPSLKTKMGTFESLIGLHGKNDYLTGIAFKTHHNLSTLQMMAYRQELSQYGIQIEDLVKWFFSTYLKEEFGADGFSYFPPSEGTTYSEKCKLIAISIDGVLKQYRLYCEDGYVDRELLQMSSEHICFENLKSFGVKKYAYRENPAFYNEAQLLYGDQSLMSYTEKTKGKHETLAQLLSQERMRIEDFYEYQHSNLQWLIDRGSIFIDETGHLVVEKLRAFVLHDLYENDVICPWFYSKKLSAVVEALAAAGELRYESTLFSKPEQDYLNYMLNKSQFSNGHDLRNKYAHDSIPLDENIHLRDYLELLKILILIVIKINDEFCKLYPET